MEPIVIGSLLILGFVSLWIIGFLMRANSLSWLLRFVTLSPSQKEVYLIISFYQRLLLGVYAGLMALFFSLPYIWKNTKAELVRIFLIPIALVIYLAWNYRRHKMLTDAGLPPDLLKKIRTNQNFIIAFFVIGGIVTVLFWAFTLS